MCGRGDSAMAERPQQTSERRPTGALIVNADDWGQDRHTTNRTLDCILHGSVSSVSAMVFMQDSERSATMARERGIDAGLHLNFTTPFSGVQVSNTLMEHQERLTRFLRGNRYAQVVFHPTLSKSFEYVTRAQLDEFRRLYGGGPERVDGHHHMHLSANVMFGRLIPVGIIVRRNFTFQAGEKGFASRLYRRSVDAILRRRYLMTDFLFTLPPLDPPERLTRIVSLAYQHIVELEVHPIIPEEFQFLAGGELVRRIGTVQLAPRFVVAMRDGSGAR